MAITGALPTAPAGIGADPDASKEYLDALTKVQKALEGRNQLNLFTVAGALLEPGRTGQFSEALGKASLAVGKDMAEQQAAEPNIAMMRAQLAGQKYTMTNDAKAVNLIAQTLGVNPTDVNSALGSGNVSQDQMAKIAQLYPVITQLSPTRGEMISKMFTMNKDMAELGIKNRQAATPEAEFEYKTGRRLPGATPLSGVAVAPVTGMTPNEQMVTSPDSVEGKISSVSPEAQNKIRSEQISSQIAENEKFKNAIPEKIDFANKQILRGTQLIDELTGKEAAFGLLKANPGIAQGIATWFNQGLQVGKFGSIRLPITETMEALLPKDQQQALQMVRSMLSEETLQKAALMKGSVSNYEDKMVQGISGSPENTAEFLKYIGQKTKLQGEFDKKVIEAYNKVGDNMLYRDWVTKSKDYSQLRGEFDKKIREAAGSTLSTMGIKPPEVMRSKADEIKEEIQRRLMNKP